MCVCVVYVCYTYEHVSSKHSYHFSYFAVKLVSDEPDIEGETAKKLLIENVMKLNPSGLSEYGFK